MDESLKQYFEFASELEKLKKIERFKGQFYWRDYPQLQRYESVADHTWRLGMLVIILADKLSQKIDLIKALKMVLIHDLPEIIAGDGSPLGSDGTGVDSYSFNQQEAEKRHEIEKNATKSLLSSLPEADSESLFNLWLEYEKQESFEAKIIKSLDKIEALMQVQEYRQGHLFAGHLEFNLNYALRGSDVDPIIAQFGKIVANKMSDSYHEFKKN